MVWIKCVFTRGAAPIALGVFVSSGQIVGNAIEEMVRNFAAERDKEFMFHVCTKQSGIQAQEHGLPKGN